MEHQCDDPLVDLVSVSFRYPHTNATAEGVGIDDVTLRVHRGDYVLIVGHNGSGKSTLLSIIAGRRKASCGKVTVLGTDAFNNTRLQDKVTLIGNPWPPEAFFGTTADKITSPSPILGRKESIAETLHVPLQRPVSHMSTGEKRRVQILHGMLHKSLIYMLDECSSDVDVAERRTVLELIKRECTAERGCIMYATHILDGVQEWATHVLLMQNGRIFDYIKIVDIKEPLETFVHKFLTRRCDASFESMTFCPGNTLVDYSGDTRHVVGDVTEGTEAVIVCEQLKYKDIFRSLSFKVYKGERVLLCGCNGAGKSTLLNMMGGKQFFNNRNGALRILGKICYEDMTINGLIAFGGDWWTSTPPGEMHVREMLQIHTPRAQRLQEILHVDLDWDIRHISSGERKRVQLLLHLLEDRPIVLLDEATADLDLDQRHELLSFLFSESVNRGVTIVYATHIFGGLQNWPSVVMILDRSTQGIYAMWRGCGINLKNITERLVVLKATENGANGI